MTVEMKKYRLADIAEIVISSVDKKTKPGEKIVRLCNFTDVYHNWAIKQSDYDSFMVASASDSNINKLSLKKGFVAFTKDSETRDDIGISTYIADDFDDVVLGYHCALAKPNEKIVYGKYLNAFMSSDYIKKYFELNATGSGMRFTLAVSTMEDMPIMLPSLNVQKKIGDMLSDFDKRIENLRAQNRVLEQTAKTIYDYTFLQCGNAEVVYDAALKRKVPIGWGVKKVSDFCNVVTGKQDANFATENGMYPFFTCSKEPLRCDRAVFSGDAVLISGNGDFNVKHYCGEFNAYQRTYVLIPSDKLYYGLVYFSAKAKISSFLQGANGSIVKFIHKSDVENIPLLIPHEKGILNTINNLLRKQLHNSKQIETLTTQRNTLLPRLMTGQIEV